jgi:TolA-binding protein
MDWFKQNKFLSGWLIVTLLGAATLGYLLFTAKSQYAEVSETYSGKVGELQTLRNQTPFPDEENFKKMQELQKTHQAAIDDLQKQLAKTEIPVAPLSAVRFQDELRESVRRITTLAAERNTKLPDKFYMAFDRYQAEPPKDEAAAPLGRMLKAMELALKTLINSGTDAITDVKREPLPEEGGGDKPATTAAARPPPGGKKDTDADNALVQRHPVEFAFVSRELQFRGFLNELISSSEQFFIPRSVVVTNEKTAGPPKGGAAPIPGVDPNVKKDAVTFVVGDEKLTVAVRVDVVDFADVAAAKPTK